MSLPVPGVSSSAIRTALREGDVGEAAALLGRPFELDGIVVAGDQRGGTLGYPTANLALEPRLACPSLRDLRRLGARAPRRDLDRDEPALRRPRAPDRAVPARLRGRSLRQAARRRGVGAAARRRRCSRPRRSSSPRSAVTSRRPGPRRGRLRLPEPMQRDARRRPAGLRRLRAARARTSASGFATSIGAPSAKATTWANACRKYVSYVSQVTYPRCGVASTASLATSGSAVAGSSSNTSTAALPGRPGGQRSGERALLDQPGAGRVDEERIRLHQREVAGGDEAPRLRRQLEMDADDIRALAERVEVRLGFVPVGGGALERRRASPGEHVHPERPSVAGDERADVPVADDPERASVQLPADGRLPRAGAKRDGVGDDAAGRGEDQGERQLGGRVRRPRAGADDDSAPGALRRGRCGAFRGRSGRSASGRGGAPAAARRSACARGSGRAPPRRRSGQPARQPSPVASDCTTTSWPCEKPKRVEALDGPLVVLHHDDAHPASLSRRRSSQARSRPQRPRSRMAATIPPDPLSAGRVFLHAALGLRRHRRKEAQWPSPRKSSRS